MMVHASHLSYIAINIHFHAIKNITVGTVKQKY